MATEIEPDTVPAAKEKDSLPQQDKAKTEEQLKEKKKKTKSKKKADKVIENETVEQVSSEEKKNVPKRKKDKKKDSEEEQKVESENEMNKGEEKKAEKVKKKEDEDEMTQVEKKKAKKGKKKGKQGVSVLEGQDTNISAKEQAIEGEPTSAQSDEKVVKKKKKEKGKTGEKKTDVKLVESKIKLEEDKETEEEMMKGDKKQKRVSLNEKLEEDSKVTETEKEDEVGQRAKKKVNLKTEKKKSSGLIRRPLSTKSIDAKFESSSGFLMGTSVSGMSLSFSSDEEDTEIQKPVVKRKKAAKKEKVPKEPKEEKKAKEIKEVKEVKKKKEKKKKVETEAATEDAGMTDIMAEIQRMKAMAEAQATGEVIKEPEPPSKKQKKEKGPKKKLSKKQKALLALEQAEKARIQAELEAQRLIEEEKKRIQEEKKMAKKKDLREIAEQALRSEQLMYSTDLIKAVIDHNWKMGDQNKKDAEWTQYLKCDGLPDPINPPQMNTYLHLWEQVIDDITVEEVVRRTNEVLRLLETLQDYIDDPFDVSKPLVDDWKWIRELCRDHQKKTLNMATYRLIRDIDSRLHRIDIPTADFNINDKEFNLCLYVLVQLPIPMYNPRNISKKKLEVDFSDIKMKVVYPLSIDTKFMATRALYVKYDHLSDTCNTYDPISIPAEYKTSDR